jgi:hypothetical protein
MCLLVSPIAKMIAGILHNFLGGVAAVVHGLMVPFDKYGSLLRVYSGCLTSRRKGIAYQLNVGTQAMDELLNQKRYSAFILFQNLPPDCSCHPLTESRLMFFVISLAVCLPPLLGDG